MKNQSSKAKITLFFISVVGLVVSSCSPKPTKVTESKVVQTTIQEMRAQVNSQTVILDTRPAIEFYANKVPGSILVDWKDFSTSIDGAKGVLDTDALNITKRLALWGIDPESQVIVLGKIFNAEKENEAVFGRVAWMLREMGVVNVKTFNYELFRREVLALNESQPINKAMWMPVVDTRSEIKFDEFQRLIYPFNYRFKFYTLNHWDEKAGLRVGRFKNAKIHYLDVRSEKEFSEKSLKTADESFPLVNLPWNRFYTDDGIVKYSLKEDLKKMGIFEDDLIIVISNHGIRSGAVTFALRQMGFNESKNFSGGYQYLENSMNLEKQINSVFFEKEKNKKATKRKRKKK